MPLKLEGLEDRFLPSVSPQLLKDINPGMAGSSASPFVQVNNQVFFAATDGLDGRELWVTDGTTAGTHLVKDINPGMGDSNPQYLTNVAGTLFFAATDGTNGIELWRSDGTAAGTTVVPAGSGPGLTGAKYLTNVGGTLFFQGTDAMDGAELWRSDGTTAGTTLIADINPGPPSSSPYYLTNVSGTLFFDANNGTNGVELWRSDGTGAGTSMVADIAPGSTGSYPHELTNANGVLFFQAGASKTTDRELWASNGTAGGTYRVLDFNPGMASSNPNYLTNVNGTCFFSADDGTHSFQLWKSNGTVAGTNLVSTINPSGNAYLSGLTNVNGVLFFAATGMGNNVELWRSNGSAGGTSLVKDINPGVASSYPAYLTNVNGILFFAANDGVNGTELWSSDGSAAGTLRVADINPGSASSYPNYLTNVNGVLFFQANDGTHGVEPWTLKYGSITTVSSSPNPSVFGQPVTFSATVVSDTPGTGAPTGSVTFSINNMPVASGPIGPGGIATFTTSTLAVGSSTITASYGGDGRFLTSSGNDSATPQMVNKDATTTTVLVTPSSLVSGQAVAFVAIVSNTSGPFGAPTGTVQFVIDGTNFGSPVALVGDVASSLPTKLSAAGSPHTVTAAYTNSDGHFLSGTGSLNQMVGRDGTSTALASLRNPSVFGETVGFTATVSALAPGSGTPTGMVDFKEGATDLTPGGVTLSGGLAIFKTSSLPVGHHTITATYLDDANFAGSSGNDASAPQVVNQDSSRTVLFAFPDPSVFGQAVSFTVAVPALAPGKGTPTGTVSFADGTTTIGSVTLSGGRATFTTASLSRGNHAINVNYGGDTNFLASNYLGFGETVLKDATTTTVTASANPAVIGHTITFTAAVQANTPGAGRATGTVTFKDITTSIGSATLGLNGQATFTTSSLALGTHAITASYGGDGNFTPSVSAIVAEVVKASVSRASAAAGVSPPAIPSPHVGAGSADIPSPLVGEGQGGGASATGGVRALAVSSARASLSPLTVDNYFASGTERVRTVGPLTPRGKHAGENGDWLGDALGVMEF